MRTITTHEFTMNGPGVVRLQVEFQHEGDPTRGSLKFSGLAERVVDPHPRDVEETLDELLATLRTFLKRSLERG